MYFSQFSRDTLTSTAADSMTNLAGLYSKLGRHDDALQLHDSALCMRRRVLPPNHPSIGAFAFRSRFYASHHKDFAGDSMWNTAIANDNLNRHQESLALQLERLKFLRRILPENHVQIGLLRQCACGRPRV